MPLIRAPVMSAPRTTIVSTTEVFMPAHIYPLQRQETDPPWTRPSPIAHDCESVNIGVGRCEVRV